MLWRSLSDLAASLRAYRRGDAPAMYRLDRICFDEAFRFSQRAMQSFAEGSRSLCVVADTSGGELAGFAIAEHDNGGLYLLTLDVAPAWRRQGLAAKMLEWLEAHAVSARWMTLHVFAGNDAAIAFYQSAGFAQAGREPNFYGQGMDALIYQRQVRSRG